MSRRHLVGKGCYGMKSRQFSKIKEEWGAMEFWVNKVRASVKGRQDWATLTRAWWSSQHQKSPTGPDRGSIESSTLFTQWPTSCRPGTNTAGHGATAPSHPCPPETSYQPGTHKQDSVQQHPPTHVPQRLVYTGLQPLILEVAL